MIRVERIDANLVLFTDEERDVAFHCMLRQHEILALRHRPTLMLDEDKCQKIYDNLLEFRVLYLENGRLFRAKLGAKREEKKVKPPQKGTFEDRMMDKGVEAYDFLEEVFEGEIERESSNVGVQDI